jgi:hypothetical protein
MKPLITRKLFKKIIESEQLDSMAASRKEYRPVALADQYSDEDHDGSEPKSAQEESSKSGWSRTTSRHRAFLTLNVTIFCLSVMFFIWSIVVSHGTQRFAKNGLLKETSSYCMSTCFKSKNAEKESPAHK